MNLILMLSWSNLHYLHLLEQNMNMNKLLIRFLLNSKISNRFLKKLMILLDWIRMVISLSHSLKINLLTNLIFTLITLRVLNNTRSIISSWHCQQQLILQIFTKWTLLLLSAGVELPLPTKTKSCQHLASNISSY